MSSAGQRQLRVALPPLLALLGWALARGAGPEPGLAGRLAAGLLLILPGWGLMRLLSVIDRRLGIAAASLTLSLVALGTCGLLAARSGTAAHGLAGRVQLACLLLALAGGLREAWHAGWKARQPPHPAPMPLWPAGRVACLAILALALGCVAGASWPSAPAGGVARWRAALQARALLERGGEDPELAGHALPPGMLGPAAAAALSAASGLHPVEATALVGLAALAAVLLAAAECVSRLRGNRGAPLAMLAVLLLCDPLRGPAAGGAGTALRPFLDATPLATALACLALLLSSTLSTLRRASYHVPRLAGAAAFGLALAHPALCACLLPGWLAGAALAHRKARTHPDNAPRSPARRPGEPSRLRAPFRELVVPVLLGSAGGWLIGGLPALAPAAPGGTLMALAALAPGLILVLPGIRQLHATPGREAFFFVGLLGLAGPLVLLLAAPDGDARDGVRGLALLLAVPAAHGAQALLERHGPRAATALGLALPALLPAPAFALLEAWRAPAPLDVASGAPRLVAGALPAMLAESLSVLPRCAPPQAVLLPPAGLAPADGLLAALLANRPLLHPPQPARPAASQRARLLQALQAGTPGTLAALRASLGDVRREPWAVVPPDGWPGWSAAPEGAPAWRAPAPDLLLVSVTGLREDELRPERLPRCAAHIAAARRGTLVFSPSPDAQAALAALHSGLERGTAPDPGPSRLARSAGALGYASAAVVALAAEQAPLAGFDRHLALPGAAAGDVVEAALRELARPRERPRFLWVHLEDLAQAAVPADLGALDPQLARLLDARPPGSLAALVAPRGRRADGAPPDLAEEVVRVPLLLAGADQAAGPEGRLLALQDVGALLLGGEPAPRTAVRLEDSAGRRVLRRADLVIEAAPDGTCRALDPLDGRPPRPATAAERQALLAAPRP